jgi:hypothetical protein
MPDYCVKCGGPHNRKRCRDCHAWGRSISMGRSGWTYRWVHDVGCSYYQPSHYPEAEQDKHREAFGGKAYSDGTCPVTGVVALECEHCWEAADRDDFMGADPV